MIGRVLIDQARRDSASAEAVMCTRADPTEARRGFVDLTAYGPSDRAVLSRFGGGSAPTSISRSKAATTSGSNCRPLPSRMSRAASATGWD